MENYVLGFCFSEDRSDVALILKNKPEWQKGFLNGIGGKIEKNEAPIDAMIREFLEETGVVISDWNKAGRLISDSFCVHIYASVTDNVYNVKTMESEEVGLYALRDLNTLLNVIPNLYWIIPACLIKDFKLFEATY